MRAADTSGSLGVFTRSLSEYTDRKPFELTGIEVRIVTGCWLGNTRWSSPAALGGLGRPWEGNSS
jgi:hypothetical protein